MNNYIPFDERTVNGYAIPNQPTKILDLQRDSDGAVKDIQTRIIEANPSSNVGFDPFLPLTRVKTWRGDYVTQTLMEAALNTPDAAEILRTGIRFLAFNKFAQMQPTFTDIVNVEPSSKPQEEYLRDAAVGQLPIVPSGTDAPELLTGFEGGVTIKNNFYRGIMSVFGDWIRFDQIGKIRQFSEILGRSLASTREKAVYSVLTTAANYARNSTTKDNDIGANTSSNTFGAVNLETALATIATSKDRKSGEYLGYSADTIVVGPRMEIPVRLLLTGTSLNRQGGNIGSNTNEQRGTGTENLYRGLINRIIVSPWFPTSGYEWLIFDSRSQWVKFQEVLAPNVMQEDMNMTSEAWLVADKIRFLAFTYFGVGIVDDRAAYYSAATSASVVS